MSEIVDKLRKPISSQYPGENLRIRYETSRRAAAAHIETLERRVEELEGALEGILNAQTDLLHIGYDSSPGGGNYIYADAVRTDDDAFRSAQAILSQAKGEGK